MTTIKIRKINNEIVKPIKTPDDDDKRPPRGKSLIEIPYSNIYCCSKKRTGKTSVIDKMVRTFCGPKTKLHVFCSTVFIDPTYIELGKWADKKKIDFYPSTSIKEGHADLLDDILISDENFIFDEDGKEHDEGENDKNHKKVDDTKRILNLSNTHTGKPRKPKPSKYKELRRIFVFDDLSNEIRYSKSLIQLLKKNRHGRYKVIISSQWLADLQPQSINQLDYVFLFKAHNQDRLLDIHNKLDLDLDFETFLKLYKYCTDDKTKFDFLYISRFEEYRKSFSELFIITEKI